jgi:putative transposase
MVMYRRNRVPGGAYFFTITLCNRSSSILVDRIDDLREVLLSVMRDCPFEIVAMVVLPEHLHALWTLPPGDDDYPGRIRLLKSRFTRCVAAAGALTRRDAKGEYDLWQRRYWEHTIRDDRDFEKHVDYIHWNPVKHSHVVRVADWPYSTFHRYAARGVYPLDWAGDYAEDGSFGE